MQHFTDARLYAFSKGLEVFSIGQGCYSRFPNIYHDTYPGSTFYTLQDFVNWCFDNDLERRLIPFEAFWAFFEPSLPKGKWPIDLYLGAVAHN
jgi:hypothetical protein